MKTSVWIIILFLAVGTTLAVSYLPTSLPDVNGQIDGIAKKRDFRVELHVVGVLDAAQSHMVSSAIRDANGKIVYLIEDGVRVNKGDVLVKLDPGPYENLFEQLKSEVASFEAAVQAAKQTVNFEKNQVEREIANAKYNVNVARLEHQRMRDGDGPLKVSALQEEKDKAMLELQRHEAFYKDLISLKEEGFDNKSEIASVKVKVAVYRDKLQTADNRYQNYKKHVLPALLESALAKKENTSLLVGQTIQGGIHKIAKAEATRIQIDSKLQAQKNALSQAQQELDKTVIHAPFDGIVIHYETYRDGQKRKPRVGDTLFPNQPILYLPDISKMIVKSKAREIDLYKLKLGQNGVVDVDAYPNAEMTGKLTFIGALATNPDDKEGNKKYFQIIFTLDKEDKNFRPGMTCRVSILSQSLTEVLSIPIQAMFVEGQKSYCLVKNKLGGYARRTIEIGVQNEDYVQVISGLIEGEHVSLIDRSVW